MARFRLFPAAFLAGLPVMWLPFGARSNQVADRFEVRTPECCSCKYYTPADNHTCIQEPGPQNGPPIHGDLVSGTCGDHEHAVTCNVSAPDLEALYAALADGDVNGVKSVLANPDPVLLYNRDRKAVQGRGCSGSRWVFHLALSAAEVRTVEDALFQ